MVSLRPPLEKMNATNERQRQQEKQSRNAAWLASKVRELDGIKNELSSHYDHLKQKNEDETLQNETNTRARKCQELFVEIATMCTHASSNVVLAEKIWRHLMEATLIGKVVKKFSKLDASSSKCPLYLIENAKVLLMMMRAALGCADETANDLKTYRKKRDQLERLGRAKPDMVAFKELREKFLKLTHRQAGALDDIPVGLVVHGRGEAAFLGIHTQILSGIDAKKDYPCKAVCLSGKYDDDENTDSEGTIIYTGMGGRNKERQVEDQKETPENVSLIRSCQSGVPVRVLRRIRGIVYRYEGLYECTNWDYGPSPDGPKVFKFTLKPIPEKSTHCFHTLTQRTPPARGRAAPRG